MQKLNRYKTFEELKKSSLKERHPVASLEKKQSFEELILLLRKNAIKENKRKAGS